MIRSAWGAALGTLVGTTLGVLGVGGVVGITEWRTILPVAVGFAALAAVGLRRTLETIALLVAAVVVVGAYTPVVRPLVDHFERRDSLGRHPIDAVVVLSSGVSDEGLVWREGLERLLSGIVLARRLGIRPLVVTRETKAVGGRTVTSEADQRRLVTLLGGGTELEIVTPVHTTHDEALGTARLARTRGWRGVAVVTSPVHSARACATFERAGLVVTCVPAESRSFSRAVLHSPRDRLTALSYVLYESLGQVAYRARGWI